MDSALAGLIGAVIGAAATLAGSVVTLRGTVRMADADRRRGHLVSLEAVKRELDLNLALIDDAQRLSLWPPLQHIALDTCLVLAPSPESGIPEALVHAAMTLGRYNTLAVMASTLIQSGHAHPPDLQALLTTTCAEVRDSLATTSHKVGRTIASLAHPFA
jgi:hypothetical protein